MGLSGPPVTSSCPSLRTEGPGRSYVRGRVPVGSTQGPPSICYRGGMVLGSIFEKGRKMVTPLVPTPTTPLDGFRGLEGVPLSGCSRTVSRGGNVPTPFLRSTPTPSKGFPGWDEVDRPRPPFLYGRLRYEKVQWSLSSGPDSVRVRSRVSLPQHLRGGTAMRTVRPGSPVGLPSLDGGWGSRREGVPNRLWTRVWDWRSFGDWVTLPWTPRKAFYV